MVVGKRQLFASLLVFLFSIEVFAEPIRYELTQAENIRNQDGGVLAIRASLPPGTVIEVDSAALENPNDYFYRDNRGHVLESNGGFVDGVRVISIPGQPAEYIAQLNQEPLFFSKNSILEKTDRLDSMTRVLNRGMHAFGFSRDAVQQLYEKVEDLVVRGKLINAMCAGIVGRPESTIPAGIRVAQPAPGNSVPAPVPVTRSKCSMVHETIPLHGRGRVGFPNKPDVFVTESHYATDKESFSGRYGLFPKSKREGIENHLTDSCRLMREKYPSLRLSPTCHEIYSANSDFTRWTPPEGGTYGQGARGKLRPSLEKEIWQGNFWFAGKMPKPGTKYIVTDTKTGKSIVVSMGYESGPGDRGGRRWLGGLTPEAQWALGNVNMTHGLVFGRAENQNLPYGPVECSRPADRR